jgi:hypothetical protein
VVGFPKEKEFIFKRTFRNFPSGKTNFLTNNKLKANSLQLAAFGTFEII